MVRTGLALGGGAARGWAHLGVIEALEENGVGIDMIAGTSFGAAAGAAYALNEHGSLMKIGLELDHLKMLSFFNIDLLNRSGLSNGTKIEEFFKENMEIPPIEEMSIPFRAVSCDLNTGEKVVFDKGDTIFAVRASSCVPVMFTTLEYKGMTLVDGGLVDPVPVDEAKDMGADVVIGVDLNHYLPDRRSRGEMVIEKDHSSRSILARFEEMILSRDLRSNTMGMWDVLFNSLFLMVKQLTESNLVLNEPDILIRPDLRGINFMDFHLAREAMEIGKKAALSRIDEIKQLTGSS